MRVTKAMIEAAQRAEVDFQRQNRAEYPDNAPRPFTRAELMRAILQAALAVGCPPHHTGGDRRSDARRR